MKIAFLSTFYPFRGGIAQFNASLYQYFQTKAQVKAFTFTRQYPKILFPGKSQYVGNDDIAVKIDSEPILDTINPLTYFSTGKKIFEYNPDMLLVKYWMPFFAPSLGMTARGLKKRGVINIAILDNVIPHEKRLGDIALTNFFLSQYHGFVVMSKSVKSDLLSLKPNSKFIEVQHPLYDHFGEKMDKFKAREILGIPQDKKVLLFFGFIRGYKGLDILLKAMTELDDSYIALVAGEVYGKFDEYSQIIIENHLESKIKCVINYISDNETPLYFSAADVCALPYKSATQSGIVGISYHFDLPVIATDVGGLKEALEPYNTGLLVDEPDPHLFAEAIKYYFANNLSSHYIPNILKYKEICSWKNLGDKIIEFYEELKK